MRAVIYARHSTEKQNKLSSTDQISACKKYVEAKGWDLVAVYKDEGISGASIFNRPGFLALTEASRKKEFDIIVAEDPDRLGRRTADVTDFHELLLSKDQELYTIHLNKVDAVMLGILVTLSQAERKKISEKTLRGMTAAATRGQITAGLSYGYVVDETKTSRRSIVQRKAVIVSRIFSEYAAGKTPESIARDLNLDGIEGPTKTGKWLDTTIRGQGKRSTGILNNHLYIGKYIFNKCTFKKDYRTAKREVSINEPSKHVVKEVPELRIISDDLWYKVKSRQKELKQLANQDGIKNSLSSTNRKRFILSSLLKCNLCGGNYTMYGKGHMRCKNHKKGTSLCENSKSVKREAMEKRVLVCLKENLITDQFMEVFEEEYESTTKSMRSDKKEEIKEIEKQLKVRTKERENLVSVIRKDPDMVPIIKSDLLKSNEVISELEQILTERKADDEEIFIGNNIPELFTATIGNLEISLNDSSIRREAVDLVQSIIEKIIVIPNEDAKDGVELELHGDLARILNLSQLAAGAQDPKSKKLSLNLISESQLALVAGARFELTTFRL